MSFFFMRLVAKKLNSIHFLFVEIEVEWRVYLMATATIICLALDLSFVLTTAFTIPKGFFKFIISLISSIRITCFIFLVVDITAYFFPIPLLDGFTLSSYLDILFNLRAFTHLAYSIHRCILTQAWPGLEKYNNLFCLMCYMALSVMITALASFEHILLIFRQLISMSENEKYVVIIMRGILHALTPFVTTSLSIYFSFCNLKKLRKATTFMETLGQNNTVVIRIAELTRLQMFSVALMFVQIMSLCIAFVHSALALGTGLYAYTNIILQDPIENILYDVLEAMPFVGLFLSSLVFVGSHFFFLNVFSLTPCCTVNGIDS